MKLKRGSEILINREEFESGLEESMKYFGNKSVEEISALIGTDVAQMVGFDQRNPHHCHNLFTHTLITVDGIANREEKILLIAAFFHDVGKTKVAMEKAGRLVFYGHATKSSFIAAQVLKDMGYSPEEIEMITFYVRHHDDFISYALPSDCRNIRNPYITVINELNIRKYVSQMLDKYPNIFAKQDLRMVMMNLLNLCAADIKAQAKYVYMSNVIVDSMEHKLSKINAIRNVMEIVIDAYTEG